MLNGFNKIYINTKIDGKKIINKFLNTFEKVFKLLDLLEENDDVQTVSANYDIADDILERLTR